MATTSKRAKPSKAELTVSIFEASALLGIKRTTLYQKVRFGELRMPAPGRFSVQSICDLIVAENQFIAEPEVENFDLSGACKKLLPAAMDSIGEVVEKDAGIASVQAIKLLKELAKVNEPERDEVIEVAFIEIYRGEPEED